VGLGAVLRSTAATVTTAVAVLFAPRSSGPGVHQLIATVRNSLPAGLSGVLVSGTGERYAPRRASDAKLTSVSAGQRTGGGRDRV
jgi:hypothetical protein